MDLSWETGGLRPSELNLACRLALAYQGCPQLLDDPERVRKVTGLPASSQSEILSVVRSIIKGL